MRISEGLVFYYKKILKKPEPKSNTNFLPNTKSKPEQETI